MCGQIPEKLRDSVFVKIIERSAQYSFVQMLRLDPFSNETLRRYPLKKLWGEVQSLLARYMTIVGRVFKIERA